MLGLYTRLFSTFAFIEMALAYFGWHLGWLGFVFGKGFSSNFMTVSNGMTNINGETALLFMVAFLVIKGYGNGKLALENTFNKKETF